MLKSVLDDDMQGKSVTYYGKKILNRKYLDQKILKFCLINKMNIESFN